MMVMVNVYYLVMMYCVWLYRSLILFSLTMEELVMITKPFQMPVSDAKVSDSGGLGEGAQHGLGLAPHTDVFIHDLLRYKSYGGFEYHSGG